MTASKPIVVIRQRFSLPFRQQTPQRRQRDGRHGALAGNADGCGALRKLGPDASANDIRIGNFAFPKLIQETLTAQSARIDSVSGATYTSGGYIKSLQSILDGSG